MHNDPALTRAAARGRFIATIIVGVSLAMDVFAAFIGGDLDPEQPMIMAVIGAAIAVSLVFTMPVGCLYLTFMNKRAGLERKPVTPGQLIIEAVVPFIGTVPAWIIGFALGLRVIGIAAAVATVLSAALLWPTERRLSLVIRGEAKVLFPVQGPA